MKISEWIVTIWEWIVANKQWLFSGIGATVATVLIAALFNKKRKGNLKGKIKAGDNSTNIQSLGTVTVGISYDQARQIAFDVYKMNALNLANEAASIATDRVNLIIDETVQKIFESNPELLGELKRPDIQHSLFQVQKEYARSGDKDLGGLLTDILVERLKHSTRELSQIILDEALLVLPKLTNLHLDFLAISFITRNNLQKTPSQFESLEEFRSFIVKDINPFVKSLINFSSLDFLHLESTGTLKAGNSSATDLIYRMFAFDFEPICSHGFDLSKYISIVGKDKVYMDLIMPCWINPSRYQFKIRHINLLPPHLPLTLTEPHRGKVLQEIRALVNESKMDYRYVMDGFLKKLVPEAYQIKSAWAKSLPISYLHPVGESIAKFYISAKTKKNGGD